MRDLLVTLAIFGSIPFILVRPHIGIVMWAWVSYMNPHRMSWGFAYDMPVAMIIGLVTMAAWAISKEPKKLPWTSISVLIGLLWLWTCFTTATALVPAEAFVKWKEFSKIILMTFMTMMLMGSEKRLQALVWITTLSIGFFSIKGGLFTIATGGNYTVWGPPNSQITDNNSLALATLMILPLMRYLAVETSNKWISRGCNAGILLSLASVVGSQSRGALVGLVAMGAVWWWKSKRRLLYGVLGVAGLVVVAPLIPQTWYDRMETIESYEEDASAMGRIEMWLFSINLANDRPIRGGGFGVYTDGRLYDKYNPGVTVRNVHSIYFEMLGTQGYVGFILFMMLGIAGLTTGGWIKRRTRNVPELQREYRLANALQIGLIGYASAGAFLNLSTLDLYYNMLTMMLLCRVIVWERLKERDAERTARGAAHALAGELPADAVPEPALRTSFRKARQP